MFASLNKGLDTKRSLNEIKMGLRFCKQKAKPYKMKGMSVFSGNGKG
jgi:hypothetical protein